MSASDLFRTKTICVSDSLDVEPTQLEPIRCDPWVASSLLQKAIRRGETETAQRAAQALYAHRGSGIWRRFLVIAFEDIGAASPEALITTALICDEPNWRSKAGGNLGVATWLAGILAGAPKDRSSDYLICSAHDHPDLGIERQRIGSLSIPKQLDMVADGKLPLSVRATATWYSSGIECGDERQVGSGDLPGLRETFRQLGVPELLVEVTGIAVRRTREPICIMVPLIWLAVHDGGTSEVVETPVPDSPLVDGVPLYALDKHTRIGKAAIAAFARETDDELVERALRLQHDQHWEQSEVWRLFCDADPDRALRGLTEEAHAGQWRPEAWRPFLNNASHSSSTELQAKLFDLLAAAPREKLDGILPAACSWAREHRSTLCAISEIGTKGYLLFWDALAERTYGTSDEVFSPDALRDLDFGALNEPGGILAWILYDALLEQRPLLGAGLPADLCARLTLTARAPGRAGILARSFLIRDLSNLDLIDPDWTAQTVVPFLSANDDQARLLWGSRAKGRLGRPSIFNRTKDAFLKAVREEDGRTESRLVDHLLLACLWNLRDQAGYAVTLGEARSVLAEVSDATRQHASWQLWQWTAERAPSGEDAQGPPWRSMTGPLFRGVWPLDARLRSARISHNLALMAAAAEEDFPDAVEAVHDLIVPFQIYAIGTTLHLDEAKPDIVARYPRALLKLLGVAINPGAGPLPGDLAEILARCLDADPTLAQDSNYIRLFGLRRLQAS